MAEWELGASATEVGNMTGADFRKADVTLMSFNNVDLTGAKSPPGARSEVDFSSGLKVYFGSGIICPDGKPGTKVLFSYDCRIGKCPTGFSDQAVAQTIAEPEDQPGEMSGTRSS